MIKDQTLDEAIVEAMRFVKAAKALRLERKNAEAHVGRKRIAPDDYEFDLLCIPQHAACKRASLDLTRKLADLREGR